MTRPKGRSNKKKKTNRRKIIYHHQDRCINPLNLNGHRGRNLRKVSKDIIKRFSHLYKKNKICGSCRQLIYQSNDASNERIDERPRRNEAEVSDADNSSINDNEFSTGSNSDHSGQSIQDPNHAQENETSNMDENTPTLSSQAEDALMMIEKLKTAFSALEENDPLRLRILTIVPDHWTLKKIAEEYNTTIDYARRARNILKNDGLFAEVGPKQQLGKRLPLSSVNLIKEFYNRDGVSRIMPGIKYTISMTVNGVKQRVQKRLLQLGLKDLHMTFKEENIKEKVSLSMFSKLRPKNCILPGARGTHCVCVCTIHQNVKMMLDAIDLKNLTKDEEIQMESYKDCLNSIVCANPTDDCFLNDCKECPGIENFRDWLRNLLVNSSVQQVKYAIWVETDRSTLLTFQENVDDFVDDLCHRLETLKPHSFIAKKQSEFIKKKRENLADDEVLVNFDFSENYAYVAQEAAQSFHYNNDQSTVFPAVYYWKKNSKVVHKSCVFLSECTKHDTAAVYTILKQLIPAIIKDVPQVKKIIYVSDGEKQHFKNRFQMNNLLFHEKDFYGISAEWHFTPTAHGKGGPDGVGACFKREARRESLSVDPKEAMLDIDTLFNWAKKYFTNTMKVYYFSQSDHDKTEKRLKNRIDNAKRLNGIMNHHSFVVSINGELEMERYSAF